MTNVITISPNAFADVGLSEQQISAILEKSSDFSVPPAKDQYRHQKNYIHKKRMTDVEYVKACREKKREQNRWKYHNDPEYRNKVLEKSHQRYAQKKIGASCV